MLEVWGEGSAMLIILRFGMFLVDYHHCVVPENIHTSMGGNGNSDGRGVKRRQTPRMEIPGGRAGLKQNCSPWGYGYFLELHIILLSPDIHVQILYTQLNAFP